MPENDERQPEPSPSTPARGTVENKAPKPAGLLPKNTQQLVILAVAVVMVLIMWLTGGAKHHANATTATHTAAARATDPATVQDFKQTIQREQAATRQPIAPSDFARPKALGLASDVPPADEMLPPEGPVPPPGGVIGASSSEPPSQPDPVKEDKKKREYLSLFAPNVAFSYRKGTEPEQLTGYHSSSATSADPRAEAPLAPSELESQLRQAESQVLAGHYPSPGPVAAPVARDEAESAQNAKSINPNVATPGEFNSSTGSRYLVFEGTILETLLINRLNGTLSGPVDCLLTTDLYSRDRQHLLMPAGTRILGEAKKVEAFGQQRLAVFFHRVIMPDGFSLNLDQFKGLNQIGETALRDKVNNHYLQIFGASLAVGILGGIAEAGTGNAFSNSPLDQARAGFGANLANSSMQILDRFLNILPTVTIREGNRVKIYLAGDLLLPDYAQHAMRADL